MIDLSRRREMGNELLTHEAAFHTTHWSVVLAARDQGQPAASEALANLCSTYWYPLYAFIRRNGFGPQDAEDLTQEFFFRWLAKDSLLHVSPAHGKFRSFLLVCLKNFLSNERERAGAQRRGGGYAAIPLSAGEAETQYLLEPVDHATPEVLYEQRWASIVLERALDRLRQEYARRERADVFGALEGFLPGSEAGVSRTETATRLGMSAGAIDMAVCRLRQRFGAVLREEVAQTVSSANEVEQELRYLISVLGA
jgi:DNA-directed RNA polymerase specialized sigma24 family protein